MLKEDSDAGEFLPFILCLCLSFGVISPTLPLISLVHMSGGKGVVGVQSAMRERERDDRGAAKRCCRVKPSKREVVISGNGTSERGDRGFRLFDEREACASF